MLIYSLTPLSTTALFTAAALSEVPMIYILPAFVLGKFGSDAVMIFSGKLAKEKSAELFKGQFSWPSLLVAAVSLLFLMAIMFIDWKELLQHKKVRFRFKIWA